MKKLINIILCTVMFFGISIPFASAFTDLDNTHENYIAIQFLYENGVVNGYDDDTFKPDQIVNRVEALKIILEGNRVETDTIIETSSFSDVKIDDWFARYVVGAKNLGIVDGNPDGTFAPARNVVRAEFIKMLLNTNKFIPEKWEGVQVFQDVPVDAWFTPYMNYAGQAGLVTKDADGNLNPGEELTRGEVAEIMYVLEVILSGDNTQFLITQSENQMAQIDIYVGANNPLAAKRAAELSVDMTQQAYKNMPEDTIILGAAKLARAYDFLMNAYIAGTQQLNDEARDWADQAKVKATEAWEVNNDLQAIARHIKNRADEIVTQLPA